MICTSTDVVTYDAVTYDSGANEVTSPDRSPDHALIEPVVHKRALAEHDQVREDLEYWLSLPHEERIAAVEHLRRQHYGNTERLQRVARVVQRA